MAISDELMRAILAMDVYNRGYNQGVDVSGTTIGNATLRSDNTPECDQGASFVAQACTIGANMVVASRGTDGLPKYKRPTRA